MGEILTSWKFIMSKPTEHQQLILDKIIDLIHDKEQYITLSGYAGTGKTFSMAYLVEELKKVFPPKRVYDEYKRGDVWKNSIAVSATTNKALKVIKRTINANGVDYRTIHSIVGMKADDKDDGKTEFVIEGASENHYDIVLIDESSMLDEDLLDAIMDFSDSTIFLFIGDPMQLPPVKDKQLAQIFENDHHFTLKNIVRQAEDNPIIGMSMKIREKISAEERVTLEDMVQWIGKNNKTCIVRNKDVSIKWTIGAIEHGKDCRIVAYTNKSVLKYNEYINGALYPNAKYPFSIGERVVFQEPFEPKSGEFIMNADELDIELINPINYEGIDAYEITARRDNDTSCKFLIPVDMDEYQALVSEKFALWKKFKKEGQFDKAKEMSQAGWKLKKAFANIRHTYASTTHKAQGSTFDISVVDFHNLDMIENDMEFNRALYVAVTRASNNVIIIG